MVELADAQDLGSCTNGVWVQVPLPAPKLDTSFDTMSIEAGVQFLFAKAPIYKGFSILFNDNRLYGDSEMVTVEPVPFYPPIPFNERSVGCAF